MPHTTEEMAPYLFPFFFVGMWIFVCTLLALGSGHVALLKLYLPRDEPKEETFISSGRMRGISYRGALYVGIGRAGLHIGPIGLFRSIFFRGIPCVPWTEIRCVERQTSSWFSSSKFEIRSASVKFSVGGDAGRAIEQALGSLADARVRSPFRSP